MSQEARTKLLALLEPVIADLGYELVEIEFNAVARRAVLRVYVDRRDGAPVTLEDCETASHAIAAALDASDPIERAYDLEVSSPGFDRPLRTAEHFRRQVGAEARIEIREPIEGRRRFRGFIREVGDDWVRVEVDRRDWTLPLGRISKARLVPVYGT